MVVGVNTLSGALGNCLVLYMVYVDLRVVIRVRVHTYLLPCGQCTGKLAPDGVFHQLIYPPEGDSHN